MRIGNIVKTFHGNVVIITKVNTDLIHWISASHGNSCGVTPRKTTEELVDCGCTEFTIPDIDCPECHGTGEIKKINYGMDKATYLDDNMFDYIKNRMMKNFDF